LPNYNFAHRKKRRRKALTIFQDLVSKGKAAEFLGVAVPLATDANRMHAGLGVDCSVLCVTGQAIKQVYEDLVVTDKKIMEMLITRAKAELHSLATFEHLVSIGIVAKVLQVDVALATDATGYVVFHISAVVT
jgi:hypothetical protein